MKESHDSLPIQPQIMKSYVGDKNDCLKPVILLLVLLKASSLKQVELRL